MTSAGTRARPLGSTARGLTQAAITALGATFLALGTWAAIDASSFTQVLADFGPENGHLVHDFGAASIAFGAALLVAVPVRGWRTPVLSVAALWNGLHTISHVVDLREGSSLAVAVTEVLLLAGGTAVLALLAWTERERGPEEAA